MLRDEVIEIMTNTVNEINRKIGSQHNVPVDALEQEIAKQKEQLDYVNGAIFDAILDNGYINTNR